MRRVRLLVETRCARSLSEDFPRVHGNALLRVDVGLFVDFQPSELTLDLFPR
jgi:hypothetical protein